MQVTELPLEQLHEAPWNPNQMDEATLQRLRESLKRYGLVQNLVVRPQWKDRYEVLSGNQRLQVLRELGRSPVPCMVVELDDAQARLLCQALNRIQGVDDLGLRAQVLKEVLEHLPVAEVLKVLPETATSLRASVTMRVSSWRRARTSLARASRLGDFSVIASSRVSSQTSKLSCNSLRVGAFVQSGVPSSRASTGAATICFPSTH